MIIPTQWPSRSKCGDQEGGAKNCDNPDEANK